MPPSSWSVPPNVGKRLANTRRITPDDNSPCEPQTSDLRVFCEEGTEFVNITQMNSKLHMVKTNADNCSGVLG